MGLGSKRRNKSAKNIEMIVPKYSAAGLKTREPKNESAKKISSISFGIASCVLAMYMNELLQGAYCIDMLLLECRLLGIIQSKEAVD